MLSHVASTARDKPVKPVGATDITPPIAESCLSDWLDRHKQWTLHNEAVEHECGTTTKRQTLGRTFTFSSYAEAVGFLQRVSQYSERVGHHPDVHVTHQCTDGATVRLLYATFATGALTEFDTSCAAEVGNVCL